MKMTYIWLRENYINPLHCTPYIHTITSYFTAIIIRHNNRPTWLAVTLVNMFKASSSAVSLSLVAIVTGAKGFLPCLIHHLNAMEIQISSDFICSSCTILSSWLYL